MSIATVLDAEVRTRKFEIVVLGRTLEHLGKQLYKRRDLAIVELIANCWDAGATNVAITVPDPQHYDQTQSVYIIQDDGDGMSDDQVQEDYLVVGRNRRADGGLTNGERLVMGRKGVGKLAGFGIATLISVDTWRDGSLTRFHMDMNDLRVTDGTTARVPIAGEILPIPATFTSSHGTRITLQGLKHKSPLDVESLKAAIARRFSRIVSGAMAMTVNGDSVEPASLDLSYRIPEDQEQEFDLATLADGNQVRYVCGYTESSIANVEMRGFAVYVHEKTAQAPPFFFNVEKTASGQHGTKYVWGEIHADFLDDKADEDSDIISTDRQEIDWESEEAEAFREWGDDLARRLLIQWASRKGDLIERKIEHDSALTARINDLDKQSQKLVKKIVRQLAASSIEVDQSMPLVDSLVRVFEYQQFHDMVDEIEVVAETDPEQLKELLQRLQDWKVLESRAILEVVRGRLSIIDKFHHMIVNDAAETAGKVGDDNMHDLIAGYPWLLHPDWQVMAEETTISKQLAVWKVEDIEEEDAHMRYDFIALSDEGTIVVIEIKRSGHAVELAELQRLERYTERIATAHSKNVYMVMIGTSFKLSNDRKKAWDDRDDGDILQWSDIYTKTKSYYEHYRAVLEGDVTNAHFDRKEHEVARTRSVVASDSVYRGKALRRQGLGPQDHDRRFQMTLDEVPVRERPGGST